MLKVVKWKKEVVPDGIALELVLKKGVKSVVVWVRKLLPQGCKMLIYKGS